MSSLVLNCELNSRDSVTVTFAFMSMRYIWIRARHDGQLACILLNPAAVRTLHAQISAFLSSVEEASHGSQASTEGHGRAANSDAAA